MILRASPRAASCTRCQTGVVVELDLGWTAAEADATRPDFESVAVHTRSPIGCRSFARAAGCAAIAAPTLCNELPRPTRRAGGAARGVSDTTNTRQALRLADRASKVPDWTLFAFARSSWHKLTSLTSSTFGLSRVNRVAHVAGIALGTSIGWTRRASGSFPLSHWQPLVQDVCSEFIAKPESHDLHIAA